MGKLIVCADALPWLESECPPCSIVASPPDADEIDQPLDRWAEWYRAALVACFRALAPGSAAVIYATDRKAGGQWHSKPLLAAEAAREAGVRLLWHKIALRRRVGATDLHRPGFSHLLAFGGPKTPPGPATPDVMERGAMVYPNGMGLIAARFAVQFAARPNVPLVDPFCGRGTVPAVAEALGFNAIGVDIMESQCEAARALSLRAK
jgi:hypothetical protein